jgi:hypothetical protein
MMVSYRQYKKLADRTADLAVAAVTCPTDVMDMPRGGLDPLPIFLGIDDGYESECAHGHCACPAGMCVPHLAARPAR